ncbi:6-carboxytetrahydropterin synthase QueD [Patescibacteria group bacterium]|nr:6-carboxytetrahydropterin synthase QueD [Patescibacteria group bacterium]MBU1703389.1 6-carboxytetrahydropterin synthase QueD [Patescibacteria group bacterium]MBU1953903.1 6-carboxytetrahydropterin synthase QueD [Patescibacteria group bacterium]
MLVTKIFSFDSAHNLTDYDGKCEHLHGHTYKLEVTVEGKIKHNGLVIDFVLLKKIVKEHVLDKLDHTYLNDTIENPSAERIAMWIWDQLKNCGFDGEVRLHEIVLWETPTSKVVFNG